MCEDFMDKLNKAFHPAEEIKDPKFFIGRGSEIREAIQAIRTPSSFLALWGKRGIGKSSLARQISLIAEGNNTLPTALGLKNLLPSKGLNYIVHYINCDKSIIDINQLLDRILHGETNTPSLFSYLKDGEKKLERFERVKKVSGGGKVMGLGAEVGGEEKAIYSITESQSPFQKFKNILGAIKQQNSDKSGIIIFIDEFDLVQNKSTFSSLIKTCSDSYIKFCVAGISTALGQLLGDHVSITRQIRSINLEVMPKEELLLIINTAEKELYPLTFEPNVKHEIIGASEGYPFFVHLLGHRSALHAWEVGSKNVNEAHLKIALESLKRGSLHPAYEQLYQEGVKHSPQREILLRAFADALAEEVCTTDVYEVVKDLGLTNPSQLMKELTSPDGGPPILIHTRDRYYRFQDPVFRTYVKIRNWKF